MGVCLFFALPAFGGESALLFGPYDWNGPALLFGVGLRVGFGVISGGGGIGQGVRPQDCAWSFWDAN